MPITTLDGLLLGIMLVSATLAMVRGFVREILSIIPWVLAILAAYRFNDSLVPYFGQFIENEILASALSIGIVAGSTLIVSIFLFRRLYNFVLSNKIGILDRSMGFVFGAARGLLLMIVGVLVFNWFVSDTLQPEWISKSKSKSFLDSMGQKMVEMLPNPTLSIMIEKNEIEESNQNDSGVVEDEEGNYSNTDRNTLNQLSTSSNN